MKMTMHIDENALAEVIEMFGCESKTEAVNFALKEVVRRRKLTAYLKAGMGMTPEEIRDSVVPGYDPDRLRVAEPDRENDYGPGSSD